LELHKIDLSKAKEFADTKFEENGFDLSNDIPNFDENFKLAKKLTAIGKTKRKDMPVVEDDQVRTLQRRLKHGALDVNKPYADTLKKSNNPFPEGLSGKDAQEFISKGFHDKKLKDDQIDVKMHSIMAKDLRPIQKQIYFDKAIGATAQFGVKGSRKFLENSLMIMSSDDYIVDGHHRWASALVIDPNMKMKGIKIDLPIEKLVNLLKAYGDAIGNKRNANEGYNLETAYEKDMRLRALARRKHRRTSDD